MRWTIKNEPTVDATMTEDYKAGRLTKDDLTVIRLWMDQVEGYGPDSLRQVWTKKELGSSEVLDRELSQKNFWNDHDLVDDLAGCRSSSFSRLGRIIYKIEDKQIRIVKVIKVTTNHKY